MNHALGVDQIGLQERIGGIHQPHPVGDEGIAVVVRLQGSRGQTPHALIVFLHGHGLGAFEAQQDFLGVRRPETKRDALVGMHFGRDEPCRWRSLRMNQASEAGEGEQQQKQETEGGVHGFP